MSLRSKFCVASIASVLLAGGTSVAQAASWEHSDAQGDVLAQDSRPGDGGFTEAAVNGGAKDADIRGVTAHYRHDALQVATSFRAFEVLNSAWRVRIETSRGDVYLVGRYTSDGETDPTVVFIRKGTQRETVVCEGLKVRVSSNTRNVATIPRTCLRSAYRVRVGIQAEGAGYVSEAVQERLSQDDALRTGRYEDSRPKLSPWVSWTAS